MCCARWRVQCTLSPTTELAAKLAAARHNHAQPHRTTFTDLALPAGRWSPSCNTWAAAAAICCADVEGLGRADLAATPPDASPSFWDCCIMLPETLAASGRSPQRPAFAGVGSEAAPLASALERAGAAAVAGPGSASVSGALETVAAKGLTAGPEVEPSSPAAAARCETRSCR